MSKDIPQVGSKWCLFALAFLQIFRSRKFMKMGGKVVNGCLSCFMIGTSGYESLMTNQEILSIIPPVWYNTAWQCVSTEQTKVRKWPDGESRTPSSHTYKGWRKPHLQCLRRQQKCRTEEGLSVDPPTDRRRGLVGEGWISLMDFNNFI